MSFAPYFSLFTIYFLLFTVGCGYQFRVEGAGPTIGGSPTHKAQAYRIKIADFENLTTIPNIELRYTTYARREFSQSSGAKVVYDGGEPADYFLKARINGVALPTINFTLQGTFEGRVTALVSAEVEDAKTNRKIWSQSVAASAEFFMTNDLQFNQVLQTRAIEQAGRLVAADLAMRFQNFLDLRDKPAPAQAPASGASTGEPQTDKPGAGGMSGK